MKKTIATILIFLFPLTCFGAVAIDSQESSATAHRATGTSAGSSPETLSYTFVNTAGTKLVCEVAASVGSGSSALVLATPTAGGSNMTLATTSTTDANRSKIAIYYMDSPPTGNVTIAQTNTATVASGNRFSTLIWCISFTGALTGAGTVTSGRGSGTTATADNLTTASGNYIVAGGTWGSGAGGTAGTGFTTTALLNGSGNTSGDDILGEYKLSAGGATSPTFTWTGSDVWQILAMDIQASAVTSKPHFWVLSRLFVKARTFIK